MINVATELSLKSNFRKSTKLNFMHAALCLECSELHFEREVELCVIVEMGIASVMVFVMRNVCCKGNGFVS